MGLIEKRTLLSQLAPPLHAFLTTQLIDEFVSLERRFIQRDWGPAELDGGQFCEVLARILYHQDSGNINLTKDMSECADYVENNNVPHGIQPRSIALHLVKVIRTVYKFRSQRGGIHISPTYAPNHMDARFIIEGVRWAMNETLRVFWNGDRETVARAIRELLQFDVPCVGLFEDVILVQRTDLSSNDELLVLLHYAGEVGFTTDELVTHSGFSKRSVERSVATLVAADCRQIVRVAGGRYRLTDLGSRYIREHLADKLLLQ
ncbi:MAG: hypothetical protein ABL986_19255 [Vicinamibacterales bacterium]